MKKCNYCNLNLETLITSISNGKENITACSDCIDINITDSISIKPNEAIKCECCNNSGFNFKDTDMEVNLCEKHLLDLLNLNLDREAFKTLYGKFPNAFLLHDDFYDEKTGFALQPRELF